jgi:hypothetical protein
VRFAPRVLAIESRADRWIIRVSAALWFGWAVYMSATSSGPLTLGHALQFFIPASIGFAVLSRVRVALRFSAWMFFFWFPLFVVLGVLNPSRAMDLGDSAWFTKQAYSYAAAWVSYACALGTLGWCLDRARVRAESFES